MPISIPGRLIDFILLGPFDDRRQLQDSPILGDVWADFGARPDDRLELLITPYQGEPAGKVAQQINEALADKEAAKIACVHGFIAANLTFWEVLRVVAPRTHWWVTKIGAGKTQKPSQPDDSPRQSVLDRLLEVDTTKELGQIFTEANAWHFNNHQVRMRETPAVMRFAALTGLILWAAKENPPKKPQSVDAQIGALLKNPKAVARIVADELERVVYDLPAGEKDKYTVYSVSRNRKATPALERSVAAVKGDAARTLFTVDCSKIGWAVLDSGIDANHPAFLDVQGNCRVMRAFDFRRFRDYISLANSDPAQSKKLAAELAKDGTLLKKPKQAQAAQILQGLATSTAEGRSIRWDLVEQLVEIDPLTPPMFSHGTHVAGIIGASAEGAKTKEPQGIEFANGLCPDIRLYDFRVLAPGLEETEFAIISALQFIRYLNQQDTFMTIHGANLSLSIPHKVRNYACGQTPICQECNKLSENGVVVVAAAGNHGYKNFTTNEGEFDGYAAFSITDPGNADDVITVGATHRFWPHTYGVSFFSSRGPTGDGRMKPDLVAPGEKIRAPLVGGQWGDQDGTSMAAPHVSGAAAMLMARYSEFIGRPRRVKQILCDTATDLGRERSFQGRGMLDVLRAFQSI